MSHLPPKIIGWGQKKCAILVTLELLIWHSLVLSTHETKQYKENLAKLNYI